MHLPRGGAHESSTKTGTGELLKFPLHYTYHFKNDALDKANKHYSAHADVILDQTTKAPKNWYLTNLSPRYEADGKTLHEDPDEYQDLKKGKKWNKWDMTLNQITEFNEDAIADWYIGDNFLTYPLKGKKPTGSEQPKDQPSEKELADLKADQVKSKNDTEAAILKDAK